MNEEYLKSQGLMTPTELSAMDSRLQKIEEEAHKNMLKHFDRLHDKLFTFNNILITGYFVLSRLDAGVSSLSIVIPMLNLSILLYIEYRMMNNSRIQSTITQQNKIQMDKWKKSINNTNLYSLLSILTTTAVTGWFLYYLLR